MKFEQILDITQITKNKRVIVIGDLHGCYDSLMNLLQLCKYDSSRDIIVLTGDLIDRGDKIKECLEFARNTPGVYTVLSNHDHKLARYLNGNKVNTNGMRETIEQCDGYLTPALKSWLDSLPCIIKFGDNDYCVHAGMNPNFPINKQTKEFCLYARHFNKDKNSFSDHSAPMWWEYDNVGQERVFFGHQPTDSHVAGKHISLDGGCVFGKELRAWTSDGQVFSVKNEKTHFDYESYNEYCKDPLLIEMDYVKAGKLSFKEKGDLVLFNYTAKTQSDSLWDEVTLRSRGIIYDKNTKEVVSYVPKKFFNLNENPMSDFNSLPLHLPYDVLEKVDGSMITCSKHKGEWIVATRGSFESEQAREAKKIIFDELKLNLDPNISYMFEVIYPANRLSVGARLVIDYGSERNVILLAAFDKERGGEELSRELLEQEAVRVGCSICKKYTINFNTAVESLQTLPSQEEGYVVRFSNGYRIKLKGVEYLRMHRILNGVSPLSIWELFKDLSMPESYLRDLPEEIKDEARNIAEQLLRNMKSEMASITSHMTNNFSFIDTSAGNWKKTLGLYLKHNAFPENIGKLAFPWFLKQNDVIFEYVKNKCRPKGNVIE